MTAPDRTTDALASALPEAISYPIQMTDGVVDVRWHTREIATFQAERLAEAGYVLVHTAPDGATVERLARVLWERIAHGATSQEEAEEHWRFTRLWYIDHAKAVLAALAGTSAQARHTVWAAMAVLAWRHWRAGAPERGRR